MTYTVHHNCCPLCHCTEMALFVTTTDHLISQRQFEIVQCRKCGFLFTQDAPSDRAIASYYESTNYQPLNTSNGFISALYGTARSIMVRWKSRLIHRHHRKQGTLIDVGAGCGHFLAYMHRQGWNVLGCEQSDRARAEASRRWQLHLDGDVMRCDYLSWCADVITAWHAVEHIHNLHGLWERFHQWLMPDGMLVVAVPNSESDDAQHYVDRWAAWDVPRHLWHFNISSITSLARQHGFFLIDINPLPLDAVYISLLSDQNKIPAIINGLRFALQGVTHSQHASSLVYMFKKQ